jgi:hypothetical protein
MIGCRVKKRTTKSTKMTVWQYLSASLYQPANSAVNSRVIAAGGLSSACKCPPIAASGFGGCGGLEDRR